MAKKIGYQLLVAGALLFGVGVVNTAVVCSAIADEEKRCDRCGHLPSKPDGNCKCECHAKKRR